MTDEAPAEASADGAPAEASVDEAPADEAFVWFGPFAPERSLGDASYMRAKGYHLQARLRDPARPTVVYAMGKSGTTAVAEALRRAGVPAVHQVHNLLAGALSIVERDYAEASPAARPLHVWDSQSLLFRMATPERPWTVVTTVRDPIRVVMASFFQSAGRRGLLGPDATVASLAEAFAPDWDSPLDWFDVQLHTTLDVDVYAHPFDPAVGHATITTDRVAVLLLRQEDLREPRAAAALSAHVGRPVEIRSANVGAEKGYAELYRRFVAEVRPPADVVERVATSRLVRHFYSDVEIDDLRARWS